MNNLVNKSNYKILNYKKDLEKLYNIIFKYCLKNNVVISNHNYNISVIKKYKYELIDIDNDFKFILFSFNPKKDGINLVNEIYLNYSKYCFLNSFIFDNEIIINIDNMKIINIYLLFENNNKKTNINFLNDAGNLYLPDYIELFHICHKLYNPTYFLKYINEYKNEFIEYNNIKSTPINGYNLIYVYNTLINNILSNSVIINKNYIDNKNIKNKIIKELFLELLNIKLNIILLDINAIQYLINNELKDINNLYFLLANIKNNKKIIINIIDKLIKDNKYFSHYEIFIKKSTFYVYNDFRLKKYIIKILDKNANKTYNIITLYNSPDYELIPIVKQYKNILIPHPIVIIRFLILNVITLQLFDIHYNKNIYNNFIGNLLSIKKINLNFEFIYYEGIYKDDIIDKFKLGSYVYRPWQYFLKNNKLLTIQ